MYTVSEWTGDPKATKAVHVYDQVADPSTTSDTLYGGGDGSNLSAGVDWYIGVASEVDMDDDFRQDGENDTDLILGLLADMNFDGAVNGLDVSPFVKGITNPSGYFSDWGLGGYVHGDMNGDGVLNGLDVDLFVAAVTGGGDSSSGFRGLGLSIDDSADADELVAALKHYIDVRLASA